MKAAEVRDMTVDELNDKLLQAEERAVQPALPKSVGAT